MSSQTQIGRPVRVHFPAEVDFSGERFTVREFTANLSVGGILLPTHLDVPVGTWGTLTFRISQWEDPFTVEAQVVRVLTDTEQADGYPPGLGIQFVDLDPVCFRKLERLVSGVRDGSIVEAIRRSIRDGDTNLERELRKRPIDQKLILALNARDSEIDAVICDANSQVVCRLMNNPRLKIPHVRAILANSSMTATVLLAIKQHGDWMNDDEIRYSFCSHPRTPFTALEDVLPTLPRHRLVALTRNGNLHPRVREKAKALMGRGSGGG